MVAAATVELRVDGIAVTIPEGSTLLEACDAAGRYVPRLCSYPGLGCCGREETERPECGLCAVRLQDGSMVLACVTPAVCDADVITQDPELSALRLERLERILSGHPHVCLTCPDMDGCTRDQCTYGYPPDARCCDELGRCELGKLVAYLDLGGTTVRGVVSVARKTVREGRIRRTPGLCVGCGRCVTICGRSPEAGGALEMVSRSLDSAQEAGAADGENGRDTPVSQRRFVARPKQGTLRASDCTFCGQCVMVCPAGALTAPGAEGVRWLADRRARTDLAVPVLPPEVWHTIDAATLATVPPAAGVFQLMDSEGRVLRIGGAADLRQGLALALSEPACVDAARFRVEIDPLFTQRESELLARHAQKHGHLPAGNDLSDEFYGELFEDDF